MTILSRLPYLICPRCRGSLIQRDQNLACQECGSNYATLGDVPNMLTEELAEFATEIDVQNRVSEEYERVRYSDEFAARYHQWWAGLMIGEVELQPPVLDNGCGVGFLLDLLPCEHKVGIDISSAMASKAASRHERIVVGNSQELPFEDNTFGTIFSRSLLHHLPSPEAGVAEMYRVLKPGGRLVVVDPNDSLMTRLPRIFAYRSSHFSDGHKNFTRKYVCSLLGEHFKIDKVSFFGFLTYPLFGFPDILPVSRYLPFKRLIYSATMGLDAFLAHVPVLRALGWAIMLTASKSAYR